MRRRIQKSSYSYIYLAIFLGVLTGAISIPFLTRAIAVPHFHSRIESLRIAQVSPSDEVESAQLVKAKDVTQGFFDSLIAGEYEAAREYLSPNIKEYFSVEDIEKQWQRVLKNYGAFEQYKKIRSTEIFDTYYVLMTANFENLIADFTVTLDSEQKIVTVDSLLITNIQANAEEFVDALSSSKYGVARGYLTPELKESLLPEDLEQRWQEIVATAGPFKYRTSSRVVESSSSDALLVNLEFAKENRSFMIVFNTLGEIVGGDFPQTLE